MRGQGYKEKNFMKTISLRRVIGMIIGVIIISLGIAIFKESHLGNDSISALNLRIADLRGVSFGVQNMTINVVFLIIEFIFGRKYIGLGTLVNGIGVGYIVTFFSGYLTQWFGTLQSLPVQLLFVVLGVLVTSLGASLYQTADLGIAPYDYLSLGLRDYTPFPYFGCRIVTDALCALLTFLLGGLVGIGTLVCAFCLGPFISFYNKAVSEKVLRYTPGGLDAADMSSKN